MKSEMESIQELLGSESVENLLLMAVLGQEPIKSMARHELKSRQCLNDTEDFTGAFMTNLSVVC